MSTTIKRVALVAVAALGLGVMSVAPSSAVPQADSLTLSASTASTTVGTAVKVNAVVAFLQETSSDSMSVTLSYAEAPAGITVSEVAINAPATAASTDLGSPTVDTSTVRVAKVSAATAASLNKTLEITLTPTKAGTYVIRVTPTVTGAASTTIASTPKTWTVTVAAKTIGLKSAFIAATTNGTVDTATADATVSVTAAASTAAKARIDVAQVYGTTGNETATAADAKSVVVATDKGLVSKTNDYSAAAKSVTLAAGTDADSTYWVFSNGDVGKASITITIDGTLFATKNVTFTGAATALVVTPTTAAPYWAVVGGTTESTTVTATDAAGSTVSIPTGLTVKSSDTSVAEVTITSGNITITPKKAGVATVTVTDPATSGAATAVSFPVHVAPVKSAAAPVISFDKTAYAVGEIVTMTITADMGDKASAALFTTALVASSNVVVTSTVNPFDAGTTTHAIKGGKVTYTFYAPAVSGTFTVKAAKTGSDVDLTTAVEVSKTVDIVNTAVDAATEAAEQAAQNADDATNAALAAADAADEATAAAQDAVLAVQELSAKVNTLIKALKAQITTLTNLVIKIQKKVKA
jgi:hypothetical protein